MIEARNDKLCLKVSRKEMTHDRPGRGRRVMLSYSGWEPGSRRSGETLEKFYFITCIFCISECGLDDFECNVFVHSGVGQVQ
jgi:hypothetical protein